MLKGMKYATRAQKVVHLIETALELTDRKLRNPVSLRMYDETTGLVISKVSGLSARRVRNFLVCAAIQQAIDTLPAVQRAETAKRHLATVRSATVRKRRQRRAT